MALGPVQTWAITGLQQLAADDPDCASTINHVGFGKFDGEFGKSLVAAWNRWHRLSTKQWAHAIRLAVKYRRQLPEAPQDFTFPNL